MMLLHCLWENTNFTHEGQSTHHEDNYCIMSSVALRSFVKSKNNFPDDIIVMSLRLSLLRC